MQKFYSGMDDKFDEEDQDPDVNMALAMAAGNDNMGGGQLNINDFLNNDGLNDEIKKLLAENQNLS